LSVVRAASRFGPDTDNEYRQLITDNDRRRAIGDLQDWTTRRPDDYAPPHHDGALLLELPRRAVGEGHRVSGLRRLRGRRVRRAQAAAAEAAQRRALLHSRRGHPRRRGSSSTPLPSAHVVADRPGGARRAPGAIISEAEAIRILRRYLVETLKISDACLAVMSANPGQGSYLLTAINGCEHTRLGRWRVDARTSAVARAK
jgi:hypothetical protein